jgi:hypothetical protein
MYWFKGTMSSLESIRTGQAGTLLLGLFVTQGDVDPKHTQSWITQLEILIGIGLVLINLEGKTLGLLIAPYYDYLLATI